MKAKKTSIRGKTPKVKLHPLAIKALKKGHPWITLDSYSAQFPVKNLFVVGTNDNSEEIALILNDPGDKKVRGRVWSFQPPFFPKVKTFEDDLTNRFTDAFLKRKKDNLISLRENFYLVFGEADLLPGLFILRLNDRIVVQYYATYWEKSEALILKSLSKALKEVFPDFKKTSLWIQTRNREQKKIIRSKKIPGLINCALEKKFFVKEFDLNYQIEIGAGYDLGLYTDMASIRKKIMPYLKKSNSVLNLFAHSGAFSLNALKCGATKVVSVDLSKKYLQLLENNIESNTDLNSQFHESKLSSTQKAVDTFLKNKVKFDFIISDPPSASSDGRKTTSSLKNYETLLPNLISLTNPGGYILVVSNTHKVSWKKFNQFINDILSRKNFKDKVTLVKRLKMSEDCPVLSSFPEGDYIKAVLLKC